MGNPKKGNPGEFAPDHYGMQPRKAGSNKGRQMANKSNQEPNVIKTKGKK